MIVNLSKRVEDLDWERITYEVLNRGFSITERILFDAACLQLKGCYREDGLYRKTIVMQRHSMGRGEYKYFAYPLPSLVQELRSAFYAQLQPLANVWCERLGIAQRFPQDH